MSKPKVALITGGSSGIGASIATQFAKGSMNIAVNYAQNTGQAESIVEQLRQYGVNALAFKCNVADASKVEDMFTDIENTLGKIDILVNCAGIMKLATLAESDDKLIDSLIAVNLKGTFNTLRQAATRLNSGGRIINLSSSVVCLKLETYGVYAATKAAVESMTSILAKELRGRSISVNAVAPGPTSTELFLSEKSPELIERFAKMNPFERLGSPKDIANIVSFLAGPKGDWVNGQVLQCNGGLV
ncbi:SDR family oxidoreductase [Aliiglaciecola aliphaticivorans]